MIKWNWTIRDTCCKEEASKKKQSDTEKDASPAPILFL